MSLCPSCEAVRVAREKHGAVTRELQAAFERLDTAKADVERLRTEETAAATEVRKASRKVLESTKVDDGIRRVEIGSQLLHREGRYGTSELVTVTEEPQWVAGRWVANNYFLDCLFWADTLKVVYMPPPEDIGGER